jgi:DNA invertase Pin-like site-specific DNA recombinase
MAELERNLIVERVCAGIRNARARGKRLGRPSLPVDQDRIEEMRASGMSLRQIAAGLNIGYGTARARLQSSERKSLCENASETGQLQVISAVT